jgi:hypothetical protein
MTSLSAATGGRCFDRWSWHDRLSGRAGDDIRFRLGSGHDTIIDFNIGDAVHHDTLIRGLVEFS